MVVHLARAATHKNGDAAGGHHIARNNDAPASSKRPMGSGIAIFGDTGRRPLAKFTI